METVFASSLLAGTLPPLRISAQRFHGTATSGLHLDGCLLLNQVTFTLPTTFLSVSESETVCVAPSCTGRRTPHLVLTADTMLPAYAMGFPLNDPTGML
eukprot:3048870-Rhodomonas_salina.1